LVQTGLPLNFPPCQRNHSRSRYLFAPAQVTSSASALITGTWHHAQMENRMTDGKYISCPLGDTKISCS
jgi:hypothetical protein